MRTESGTISCISVTNSEIIQNFLNMAESFSGTVLNKRIPSLEFGSSKFIATVNVNVEGLPTATLNATQKQDGAWLEGLIGKNYAFVQNMREHDLPIIARNHLENGISTNLWYEEFVPHGSIFYTAILTPEKDCKLDFTQPIQIGGNASIGYGFTKIEEISLSNL